MKILWDSLIKVELSVENPLRTHAVAQHESFGNGPRAKARNDSQVHTHGKGTTCQK